MPASGGQELDYLRIIGILLSLSRPPLFGGEVFFIHPWDVSFLQIVIDTQIGVGYEKGKLIREEGWESKLLFGQ